MRIVEGKFYQLTDGRIIGPMRLATAKDVYLTDRFELELYERYTGKRYMGLGPHIAHEVEVTPVKPRTYVGYAACYSSWIKAGFEVGAVYATREWARDHCEDHCIGIAEITFTEGNHL